MNQAQKSTVRMYSVLISFFDESKSSWSDMAPVEEVYDKFRSKVAELTDNEQNQSKTKTVGYTNKKNSQKETLIDLANNLSLKLKSYALLQNELILLETVNLTVSKLGKLSDQDLVKVCEAIYDKGIEFKSLATAYNIGDEELNDLQIATSTFNKDYIDRDKVADKRVLATKYIASAIREGNDLLAILDITINGMVKDKAFVAAYHQARKVTDTSSRGKAKQAVKGSEEGKIAESDKPADDTDADYIE